MRSSGRRLAQLPRRLDARQTRHADVQDARDGRPRRGSARPPPPRRRPPPTTSRSGSASSTIRRPLAHHSVVVRAAAIRIFSGVVIATATRDRRKREVTSVPPAGQSRTTSWPPMPRARSFMPLIPFPGRRPREPTPSSATPEHHLPVRAPATARATADASACRRTFVRLSWAMRYTASSASSSRSGIVAVELPLDGDVGMRSELRRAERRRARSGARARRALPDAAAARSRARH